MAYDKFLIAPFDSGLDKSMPVWLTTEDSFQRMDNAYLYRGRVRKRFGSQYMGSGALSSRLRINLGPVLPAGTFAGFAPGTKGKIGQQFSIGANIYTVYQANGDMLRLGGAATIYTYNTATRAYNFADETPGTAVYFYSGEPVMGLDLYETGPVNNHPVIGFDTQFAYTFTGGGWEVTNVATVWKGNDSDFFWCENWRGATPDVPLFFATNFNSAIGAPIATDDPMYYWNGATWTNFSTLTVFIPAADYVQTARVILAFENRLLLLNTIERDIAGAGTNIAHPNRARWSWIGSPIAANAWTQPNQIGYQGAGYADAPTQEAIVGAEFIKNRLIVYFERSTWELVSTRNAADPFFWQKLNSELGTQSTFSTVIFDKVILSIGNTGVEACNGSNVERIDDKIPDDIFKIRTTNNGIKRVCGIRDYQTEVVYWSWPLNTQATFADTFPAKLLVYNYKNGTWAYFDDTITTFGYFEQDTGLTWSNIAGTWEDYQKAWNAGTVQAQAKRIIAGNQQGFVFIVEPNLPNNAGVMQISALVAAPPIITLTIIDHTLQVGDFIQISNVNTILSGTGIYRIDTVPSKDTVTLMNVTAVGAYTGGGLAARVSKVDIVSKQWNPYKGDGANFHLAKMDFCVLRTNAGEITVDYSPNSAMQNLASDNGLSIIGDATATNSILGTSILDTKPFTLYPLESLQERLWHPIYFQTQGDCIQIRLYWTDAEMVIPTISQTNFVLEGIMLYTKQTSGRLE